MRNDKGTLSLLLVMCFFSYLRFEAHTEKGSLIAAIAVLVIAYDMLCDVVLERPRNGVWPFGRGRS